MVQTSGAGWTLAPALRTLLGQLQARWPGQQWQTSPQTGTIGDQAHAAEGWTGSDHNAFMAPTGVVLPPGQPGGLVRALDIAADVRGVPGIHDVADAPDCEALFRMVNAMYARRDPRVYPNGYAIYNRRITDWDNPGGFHAQEGDPHLYHLHISVSRLAAGFNSTAPWPLPGTAVPVEQPSSGPAVPVPTPSPVPALEVGMFRLIRNVESGAIRLAAPGRWTALEGKTAEETKANVEYFRKDPLCAGNRVDDVSNAGMLLIYHAYITGKVA